MKGANHNLDRQTSRIGYIDGFRGIASVLVIFCHLSCVFVPGLSFFDQADSSFEKLWLNSPLNVLTNGNAAVQCFFVLSGFLITRKVYLTQEAKNTPISEYKKLLRVIIPGVLLAFFLMAFGLMFHLQASEKNPLLLFVNDYNAFPISIKNLVIDCFARPFYDKSIYVGPFWTIKYEFFGALLITIASYYAFAHKNSKWIYLFFGTVLVLISSGTISFSSYDFFCRCNLFSFFAGAFVYDCIGKDDNSAIGRFAGYVIRSRAFRIFMLVLGVYLFSVQRSVNRNYSDIWRWISYIPLIQDHPEVLRAIGFSFILIVVLYSPILQKILSIRQLSWLGSISAYTYAFHWPIILSVGCGIYLLLSDYLNYYVVVFFCSIAVFVCTIVLAYLYKKMLPKIIMIEKRIGKLGNRLIICTRSKK